MAVNPEFPTLSPTTPKLNKALVAARKGMSNPKFDSENPHFRSKFASLKSVFDAVIPALLDQGIFVAQDLVGVDDGIGCYTHLMHESGEEKRFGPFVVHPTKRDPQGEASASTYARRYGLQAVAGVVGDVDDDGNAASASAFTSVAKRSTLRNKLIAASNDGDDATVVEITSGFDNDQKAEMWGLLSKPQRKLVTESIERTKEPDND